MFAFKLLDPNLKECQQKLITSLNLSRYNADYVKICLLFIYDPDLAVGIIKDAFINDFNKFNSILEIALNLEMYDLKSFIQKICHDNFDKVFNIPSHRSLLFNSISKFRPALKPEHPPYNKALAKQFVLKFMECILGYNTGGDDISYYKFMTSVPVGRLMKISDYAINKGVNYYHIFSLWCRWYNTNKDKNTTKTDFDRYMKKRILNIKDLDITNLKCCLPYIKDTDTFKFFEQHEHLLKRKISDISTTI